MKRPQDIAVEEMSMATIVTLTNAFEGLASMRIAQIKNQVLQAQQFFSELWDIYHQLRVDNLFRFGRHGSEKVLNKELFIAVTAEGGFSGDIDQRLIKVMMNDYNPTKHDIIIIGHHGALQLKQAGIEYKKYFKLPEKDHDINVTPLVAEVRKYRKAYVYYQTYASLMVQDIKRIELSQAVQEQGRNVAQQRAVNAAATKDERAASKAKEQAQKDEEISEKTYIFEPDAFAVVAHLERSMIEVSLSQVILDSKLAQYASRFRAMSVANDRSSDSLKALHTGYNRARRMQSDERLKEIINGLKKTRIAA
jgi:ATP synthase F1 gamma subunit